MPELSKELKQIQRAVFFDRVRNKLKSIVGYGESAGRPHGRLFYHDGKPKDRELTHEDLRELFADRESRRTLLYRMQKRLGILANSAHLFVFWGSAGANASAESYAAVWRDVDADVPPGYVLGEPEIYFRERAITSAYLELTSRARVDVSALLRSLGGPNADFLEGRARMRDVVEMLAFFGTEEHLGILADGIPAFIAVEGGDRRAYKGSSRLVALYP